jgi:hypothetical protein
MRRFLLKSVEDVDRLQKSNNINDPVCVPRMAIDELKDAGTQALP